MARKNQDASQPVVETGSTTSTRNVDVRRLQLRSRRMVNGDMLGAYRTTCKGSGLVYSDLREYQPGDDVKHIHWKATARTDKVVVKSYDEERQLRVLIAVDISSSLTAPLHSPLRERALEFTSLIATLAQKGNDLLGACLFSDSIETFIPPSSSPGRHQKILTLLQRRESNAETRRRTNLESVLRSLHHSLRQPTLLFLLSDFLTPPFDAELRKLASKHDVVLVHLEQPLAVLPQAGLVSFTDPESGRVVTVDSSSPKVRLAWSNLIIERREALHSIARQCAVDLIHLKDSAIVPLTELMAARANKRPQIKQRSR
jgi:uncharacterized protein (DUF58 family)